MNIESAFPNPHKRTLSLQHGIPLSSQMQQHFPDIGSTLPWVKDILEIQQIGMSALKTHFVFNHITLQFSENITGELLVLSKTGFPGRQHFQVNSLYVFKATHSMCIKCFKFKSLLPNAATLSVSLFPISHVFWINKNILILLILLHPH